MEDDPDLLGAEQKQVGGLAWSVYQTYWVAVGGVLAASILMSLFLMQGLDGPLCSSASCVSDDDTRHNEALFTLQLK